MRSFPLFKELEAERDKVNAEFHKATKPQLIERLKEFGFMQPDPDNPTKLVLAEKATDNVYHLSINRYSVTVQFQHVRTGEVKLICDISNFAMNTHNMMNVIIKCVDYWLQYGVVYDYDGNRPRFRARFVRNSVPARRRNKDCLRYRYCSSAEIKA